MSVLRAILRGGAIFDGTRMIRDHALILEEGRVAGIVPEADAGTDGAVADLAGDLICPGYVDLQVNGGGGVMFNDDPSVEALRVIAAAHRTLGATTILPTLVSDTHDRTRSAIDAVAAAIAAGVAGIGGLHLEGPHLSLARKGAHDPAMIRPMTEDDLARLCDAARRVPALMVTLAPENATTDQVRTLSASGAIVSLGHSDAEFATCNAYQAAGARCVTHLFNAMSQFGSRAPGLVGAALDNGGLSASLIADRIHVHPAAMRAAMAAKCGPGRLFLVSDAMSCAGTDQVALALRGRRIRRADGQLRLEDGTLAGADLDLTRAVDVMIRDVGLDPAAALAMATRIPATLARPGQAAGRLVRGRPCSLIRLSQAGGGLRLVEVIAG